MGFRGWLLENEHSSIITFNQAFGVSIPKDGVISFDFDGTLTKWNKNLEGWYEVPFMAVINTLKDWSQKGHKCIITTHRTKELEGNPAFVGKGIDKMEIVELIKDDALPITPGEVIFTHMGDKGQALIGLRQKGINVALHYDDEMKNLLSVASVGIIGVRVDPGPEPPKTHVAGDGT